MKVAFVSTRDDPHTARFDRFFQKYGDLYLMLKVRLDRGGNPSALCQGTDLIGWSQIRKFLNEKALMVVSGPLDECTVNLIGGDYRHVGISWATDIMGAGSGGSASIESLQKVAASLDAFVTDNYASENALVALGAEPSRIVRFPWGPTPSLKATTQSHTSFGLPSDKKLFLFARSLEPHYQPELFVQAIEDLATSHPKIMGVFIETGSRMPTIKKMLTNRGIESLFFWQPAVSPEQFAETLRAFDAVVMAPITDGTSVTLIDAMDRKVPVICSLTNGSSEWIIDGVSGWTFPSRDQAGLTKAMGRFLDSEPRLIESMIDNAFRLVSARANWRDSQQQFSVVLDQIFATN